MYGIVSNLNEIFRRIAKTTEWKIDWKNRPGHGGGDGGSGIPIYPIFSPQDTNIPQNLKMSDTKYLTLFWNRIPNSWKWTRLILVKEKLVVHCPPLPLRSNNVNGDRIFVTLFNKVLCNRFFSFIARGGVRGSVQQGSEEQIVIPLIYFTFNPLYGLLGWHAFLPK